MSTPATSTTSTKSVNTTVHPARKSFGLILVAIVSGVTGWIVAWNQNAITEFLGTAENIPLLIVVAVGILALILSVVQPKKWPTWIGKVILICVLLYFVVFDGAKGFRDAFAQAPWMILIGLLVLVIVGLVLHGITILDKPIDTWRAAFRKKK